MNQPCRCELCETELWIHNVFNNSDDIVEDWRQTAFRLEGEIYDYGERHGIPWYKMFVHLSKPLIIYKLYMFKLFLIARYWRKV